MDKEALMEREEKIIELAVAFCNEKLDEECVTLCTKLVQKLGRKRSCPLMSGRLEIWAAAVVYTICSMNFIFYKDSKLHLSATDVCDYFDTSTSTTQMKSKAIRDMLKIKAYDPDFSLKSVIDSDPFNRIFCFYID